MNNIEKLKIQTVVDLKEYYNRVILTESISDYDFDDLLNCLSESSQKWVLSLSEVPIGFLIENYKNYQNIKTEI